ncbi:MAG: hypothetical protein P4L53_12925 [Candidatus Obscuribacterales bacterium]|nr:hypothetical protein [Candidatus Obscuribacterales bacterium]
MQTEDSHESAIPAGGDNSVWDNLRSLTRLQITLLCVLLASTIVFQIYFAGVPASEYLIGADKRLSISPEQALQKARDILISAGGQEIAELPSSVVLTIKPKLTTLPWKYGIEHSLMERARSIYDETQPGISCVVRFQKENETQSHVVTLDGSGAFIDSIIEDVTNKVDAEPNKYEAQKLAEEYVRTKHATYLPIIFQSIQREGKLKRAGSAVCFLVPKFDVGDAHCVLKVKFARGQVNTSDLSWIFELGDLSKPPRIPLIKSIEMCATFGLFAVVLLFLLGWVVVNVRVLRHSWKPLLVWLFVIFCANIFNAVNDSVELMNEWGAPSDSNGIQFVNIVLSVLKLGLFTAIQLLLCTSGFIGVRKHFPGLADQLSLAFWLRPASQRAAYKAYVVWRQACLGALIILWVENTLANLEVLNTHGVCTTALNSVSEIFNAMVPSAHIVTQVFIYGIVVAAAMATIATFCRLYLNSGFKFCVALICGVCILTPWDRTAISYCEVVLLTIFGGLFDWFALRNVFKENAAIYLILSVESIAIRYLSAVFYHTAIIGSTERNLLLGIILSPLLVLLLFWFRQKSMKAKLV